MNKNIKAELFEENNKTYMRLEFDQHKITNEIFHTIIHKIDMSEFQFSKSEHTVGHMVSFYVYPINDGEILTQKDITPPREMTVQDIERKLGYKIKIVG